MNSRRILMALAAAMALTTFTAAAQENIKYLLNIRATARTTTESGRFVNKVLTTRDIIRFCAERAGLGTTNLNQYVMIYDQNSDFNGDTIKVVRRSDGGSICQPFRVLFQNSITNGEGARDERVGLMFNSDNTDTMGSVVLVEKAGPGTPKISGRFQMFDEIFFPERKAILVGNFVTGRQVSWE